MQRAIHVHVADVRVEWARPVVVDEVEQLLVDGARRLSEPGVVHPERPQRAGDDSPVGGATKRVRPGVRVEAQEAAPEVLGGDPGRVARKGARHVAARPKHFGERAHTVRELEGGPIGTVLRRVAADHERRLRRQRPGRCAPRVGVPGAAGQERAHVRNAVAARRSHERVAPHRIEDEDQHVARPRAGCREIAHDHAFAHGGIQRQRRREHEQRGGNHEHVGTQSRRELPRTSAEARCGERADARGEEQRTDSMDDPRCRDHAVDAQEGEQPHRRAQRALFVAQAQDS